MISFLFQSAPPRRRQAGFSLVELMISITIGLLMLVALCAMFVNVSNANNEMAKSNSQIENGRFSIQVLESDLMHAGFWGEFLPQFDDLNWPFVPADTPSQVPDPCLAYNATNWNVDYINALIGIPVQSSDAAPSTCVTANKKTDTDVLVVRHAATCVPGDASCEADIAGKLYFQNSMCAAGTAGTVQAAGNTLLTIALKPAGTGSTTTAIDNAYAGMTIRITGGTNQGQARRILSYNASTFIATVTAPFTNVPDTTSTYTIVEDVLATTGFSLHARGADCSVAAAAPKRKFISTLYYVRDYATTAGDGIPTLVRSSFDLAGTPTPALAHQGAEALVEGVDRFAVELGIDNVVSRCGLNTAVNLAAIAAKVDPNTCATNLIPENNTLPTNRGDGNPDQFVRCTTAAPCTAAQLANVVATKLFVLVRNTQPSPGYTDTKTYCMASLPANGVCPTASVVGPLNDHYKRHLFSTTVRLTSVSGRRETPR